MSFSGDTAPNNNKLIIISCTTPDRFPYLAVLSQLSPISVFPDALSTPKNSSNSYYRIILSLVVLNFVIADGLSFLFSLPLILPILPYTAKINKTIIIQHHTQYL